MPLDVVPIFKISSQKRGNFIKIISKLKKNDPRLKSKPFSILAFLIKDDLEKKMCVKKKSQKLTKTNRAKKRLFTERANHPTPLLHVSVLNKLRRHKIFLKSSLNKSIYTPFFLKAAGRPF